MIGPSTSAPDLMQEVVGFRSFYLKQEGHDYYLGSPYTEDRWDAAEKHAVCHVDPVSSETSVVLDGIKVTRHAAPAKGCKCGIYSVYEVPLQEKRDAYWSHIAYGPSPIVIPAAVALSGRLEVHLGGCRAERARIVALGDHEGLRYEERVALYDLGRQLDVPVVPQAELEAKAAEVGEQVPLSLRPSAPALPGKAKTPKSADPPELDEVARAFGLRPKKRRLWLEAAVDLSVYLVALMTAAVVLGSLWVVFVGAAYCTYLGGKLVESFRARR